MDSLSLLLPRTVGVGSLALWAMQQLQFTELLEALGFKGAQRY